MRINKEAIADWSTAKEEKMQTHHLGPQKLPIVIKIWDYWCDEKVLEGFTEGTKIV